MNFLKEIKKVRSSEGGYSNDPDDPGGETYCGISRKFFPRWIGWHIVDRAKRNSGRKLRSNEKIYDPEMYRAINEFYFKYFWAPLKCDRIKDPILSAHLFDCGINLGKSGAVKFFQESINKKLKKSDRLIVDGKIGRKTLKALNSRNGTFVNFVVQERINLYFEKCRQKPVKYKFLKGWTLRSLKYLKKH